MKWIRAIIASCLFPAVGASGWAATEPVAGQAAIGRCELSTFVSADPYTKVTSAEIVAPDASGTDLSWAEPDDRPRLKGLAPFCRVAATIRTSQSSRVGVEVWLPVNDWNGRLLGTGNGAYPTAVAHIEMIPAYKQRFAVVNTDMGLAPPQGKVLPAGVKRLDSTPLFVGDPSRFVDFGWRSTHLMTVFAKQAIRAFYGRDPEKSYFTGCSTGGMQGFREAQQFPDDYDGVLVGSPGANRARLTLSILWNSLAVWKRPERVIPDDKLRLMNRAVVARCAGLGGGLASDSYISSPLQCGWKPEALLCSGADGKDCLTKAQVTTANLIYEGPRNPRTGSPIMPGLALGSELEWSRIMRSVDDDAPMRSTLFVAALGKDLDFAKFDWDRDADAFISVVAPLFDATNPDLDAFRKRGGKMMVYYGWSDSTSSPVDAIAYRRQLLARMQRGQSRGAGAVARGVDGFFRLFLMPGANHCQGGPGPDSFDGIGALADWVENGRAPERMDAARIVAGKADQSRPICAYPKVARYIGRGDRNSASSFACGSP